jgi:hypothetical protein
MRRRIVVCVAVGLAGSLGLSTTQAAPPPQGDFSRVAGPAKLKVKRPITGPYFVCRVQCRVRAYRIVLRRPGKNLRLKAWRRVLAPGQRGRLRLGISKRNKDQLKKQARRSRLLVRAKVTNANTGEVDYLGKNFRFKAPKPKKEGGGNCAPGYSPCLPIVNDLDCDDIPDSQKPIVVTGSDPYNLDGDGDGLGCE